MLDINKISKDYKNHKGEVSVLKEINLKVDKGELIALLGPNGCGKSTLLNIVSGLTDPTSGEVLLNGSHPSYSKIGFVFQDYRSSLFPWLTVYENATFSLRSANISNKQRRILLKRFYKILNCDLPLNTYPYELSGGQQQLISIIRALIINPELLLLDEPFTSLDYRTTLILLENLCKALSKLGTTTLFVSHNVDEAIFLARKIVLLSDKPTKVLKTFVNSSPYPRKTESLGSSEFSLLRKKIIFEYTKNKKLPN